MTNTEKFGLLRKQCWPSKHLFKKKLRIAQPHYMKIFHLYLTQIGQQIWKLLGAGGIRSCP